MSGPGRADPKVPLLLVHGTKDEVVPPALTAELLTRYCGLGATAARKLYPGADHFAVTDQAADDVRTWLLDRFAGHPASNGCP